jgi:bile acid:Na+ symporter, BASS family
MTEVLSLLPLDVLGAVALVCVFLSMMALGAGARPTRVAGGKLPLRPVIAALGVALVAVPLAALVLARVFGLSSGPLAGLLLMGISPGAPLALKKTSDEGKTGHFALVLQVIVAVASIAAVPVWLLILGALYGRPAGLSFVVLAKQVFIAQILPLGCGMALAWWRPEMARRLARRMLRIAGIVLVVVALLLLAVVGPGLATLPVPAIVASVLLSVVAVALAHFACGPDPGTRIAAGVVCALRNPGIALLVASANGLPEGAKIMVVCHVVTTAIVLGLYLAAMRRSVTAVMG